MEIGKIQKILIKNWHYILIYIFFFFVALIIPSGGDDWELSTWYKTLIPSLVAAIRAWSYLSGRISVLTGVPFWATYKILWNLVSPFIYCLIIWSIVQILKIKNSIIVIASMFLMLLSLSPMGRAETQFWITGNVSYNFCIAMILTYMYWIIRENENATIRFFDNDKLNMVVYFLFALFTSLWIENLTLAFMTIVFLYSFYTIINKKKFGICLKSGIIGCAIGFIFLYSSIGIESRINHNMTILETVYKNLPLTMEYLIASCLPLYAICASVILIAIWKKVISINNLYLKTLYSIWNIFIILLTVLVQVVQLGKNEYVDMKKLQELPDLLTDSKIGIAILFLIILSLLIAIFNLNKKHELIILYLAAVISVAPMVLSPGARNMIFAQYVVIALAASLVSNIKFSSHDGKKLFIIIVGIAIFIRIDNYFYYLLSANEITKERVRIIQDYQIESINSQEEEDLILILPVYKDEINYIANLSRELYASSIIEKYNLNSKTKVLFDDGFLVENVELSAKENSKLNVHVEQYIKYNKEYSYRYILLINGTSIDLVENTVLRDISFKTYGNGQYQVKCIITDNNSGIQKEFESNVIDIK